MAQNFSERNAEAMKLLTVDQCAELTATSVAFWRKAIARKEIPVHRFGRRNVRIAQRDLEAMLRRGFSGGNGQ